MLPSCCSCSSWSSASCPGYGLPTAVLLGAGTLLLPFATLFFDHVLSAALGFAAFVVLMLERERRRRVVRSPRAGVLAGLAVVVEFPLGIVAVVLGRLRGRRRAADPPVPRRTPAVSWSASCRSSPTTRGRSAHRSTLELHERAEGTGRGGGARRRRERRGLLRRRASGPACRALAPRSPRRACSSSRRSSSSRSSVSRSSGGSDGGRRPWSAAPSRSSSSPTTRRTTCRSEGRAPGRASSFRRCRSSRSRLRSR